MGDRFGKSGDSAGLFKVVRQGTIGAGAKALLGKPAVAPEGTRIGIFTAPCLSFWPQNRHGRGWFLS
jgi:hypothetical protein